MLTIAKIERARILWLLGDWKELLAEANDSNDNIELKFYKVAALYQLGSITTAKEELLKLVLTEEQKLLLIKVLVSGAYNVVGRAYACNGNYEHAEVLCKNALIYTSMASSSDALLNARVSEQFAQLGIPRLYDNIVPASFKPNAEYFFCASYKHFSHEPAQEIALAELYQLNERYEKAVVHWQGVSGLLNAATPQIYYDRLKDAYKSLKGFPQGTEEQEALFGDIDKHQLLSEIHKHLQPEFYFEIGVQTGKSLALAQCESIGIDPMPMLNIELPHTARVVTSSSDNFFATQSNLLLKKSIDFCFIDGMHLFEYALRDLINVEKYAQPSSLIVIDDIFPGHPDQAKRERCTRAWTGDVWKLKNILEKYRPDLYMLTINAYPTGLLLITALDPDNKVLDDHYYEILKQYSTDLPAMNDINRSGAIPGKSKAIFAVIEAIKNAKSKRQTAAFLKETLIAITGSITPGKKHEI